MAFLLKRKYPRHGFRDGIKILGPVGSEYATYEDVSIGGIRLLMDREPIQGERLDMELRLPGMQRAVQLSARVIRVQPWGRSFEVGAAFSKDSSDLSSFLKSEIDLESGPH